MAEQVVIVGGGAAGFFAAIHCAELNPACKVTILEGGKNVLAKVKISGGGRCNLTHACWTPRELVTHYPRGSRELLGPFNRFACSDTVDWFARRGVETKVENDGRMFPATDRSTTIVDCLMTAARNANVDVRYHARVESIAPPGDTNARWQIKTEDETFNAICVMLATGSNRHAWDMLQSIGHTIVTPVPSLFTFNIKDPRIDGLPGISVPDAHLKLPDFKLEASGPLLITHWGLSGPGVLRLSAWGARDLAEVDHTFDLIVNWLHRATEDVRDEFVRIKSDQPKRVVTAKPLFGLPARFWPRFTQAAGIAEQQRFAELSNKQLQQLSEQLTRSLFRVTGKSTFKDEFVTAGGVDLREVDFKRFESRIHPGLFMAGEVLDIDAITGGFNFQAAWTGGHIAGEAMAERAANSRATT